MKIESLLMLLSIVVGLIALNIYLRARSYMSERRGRRLPPTADAGRGSRER